MKLLDSFQIVIGDEMESISRKATYPVRTYSAACSGSLEVAVKTQISLSGSIHFSKALKAKEELPSFLPRGDLGVIIYFKLLCPF
jgi:hypothetical protein